MIMTRGAAVQLYTVRLELLLRYITGPEHQNNVIIISSSRATVRKWDRLIIVLIVQKEVKKTFACCVSCRQMMLSRNVIKINGIHNFVCLDCPREF